MTSGPLTHDDLLALWKDVTDESYWRPLVNDPDSGIEAIEQAIEQTTRASLAVDRSTQALFIFPWSGQTDAPASGGAKATVDLIVTRAAGIGAVVLDAGLVILHTETDYGPDGGQLFTTGRKYIVQTRATLLPGSVGPLTVHAEAELEGTGYNLPQPGTIQQIAQLGSNLHNTGIVQDNNRLQIATGAGDLLAPTHVLGYIAITTGSNAGQRRRIVHYNAGSPSSVQLDAEWVLRGVLTGTWVAGETVTQGTAVGQYVAGDAQALVIEHQTGTFGIGAIVGSQSGASFAVTNMEVVGPMIPGSADWHTLAWDLDLGISISNPALPTGGRLPMLDELGDDRGIPRATNESDDLYRQRVGTPADVVTPNAIRRAANHVLSRFNLACCFRQVGSKLLPGFYYDAGSSSQGSGQKPETTFAYDMPMTIPGNRFKLIFDLVHFRAWFMLGIPRFNVGEFGFAYDAPTKNAYDARIPAGNFYDGFPVGNRAINAAIFAAVERARMGGVRWDMYVETIGCV